MFRAQKFSTALSLIDCNIEVILEYKVIINFVIFTTGDSSSLGDRRLKTTLFFVN